MGSGVTFHQEELFIFHSTLTELQVICYFSSLFLLYQFQAKGIFNLCALPSITSCTNLNVYSNKWNHYFPGTTKLEDISKVTFSFMISSQVVFYKMQHVMFSSFRGKIFNQTWFERIHKNWPWNQIKRVILKLSIFQNILDKSLRRGGLPRDLMVSIFAAKVHAFSASILKFLTKKLISLWPGAQLGAGVLVLSTHRWSRVPPWPISHHQPGGLQVQKQLLSFWLLFIGNSFDWFSLTPKDIN